MRFAECDGSYWVSVQCQNRSDVDTDRGLQLCVAQLMCSFQYKAGLDEELCSALHSYYVCKVLGRLREKTEGKQLLTAFLSFPFKGKRAKNKHSKQQQQQQQQKKSNVSPFPKIQQNITYDGMAKLLVKKKSSKRSLVCAYHFTLDCFEGQYKAIRAKHQDCPVGCENQHKRLNPIICGCEDPLN